MENRIKTVVITGASSGFGEDAVKCFADRGYRVWGTMRDTAGRKAAKKAALEAYSPGVSILEIVDAYLKLAEMPAGQRPVRTVVGIAWGVDEMNRLAQPIQDKILNEMQLDGVLGGVSA